MDDLISRQEAVDALDKILPADPMKNDYTQGRTVGTALAIEYIKQLPSAQPEQHWIPCSERLPEEEQTVLVTCSDGQVYIYDRLEACDYEYDDMRFWEDNMGCYQPREDVIAWMPLPEPYAERRTDD